MLSYYFFGDKKKAFKSSLDMYFHLSIIDFRIDEMIRIMAVVIGRRFFLFSWERLGEG